MALLFPAWTCVMGFILGAFVGSFLNMAIYRLPRGKSFFNPSRSFCPNCEHALGAPDLFPILSWLLARGRCRYCDQRIASRYLWVEVLTGSLFAGVWFKYLTETYDPLRAGFSAIMIACLIAVIYIDWELYIIPDELNAAILVTAIAFQALQGNLHGALVGGLTGWGILFGIVLLGRLAFGKDAMGDGDVKMMRGVGAFLGPWLTVGNMAIAVVVGLIGGIAGILIANRSKGSGEAEAANDDDEPMPEATPVPLVLLAGIWYLLCLDVLALFIPPLNKWVHRYFPEESVEEEDDWKPGATTIPFGPYLAAGALICILFGAPIESGLKRYFHVAPDVSSTSEP
ncbi:prepilin peptidase [Fimbriimonas ginsengisoli]|uniref:Leader peptidase PppA n=1 Tax=Fimbriimonas ginsengisoli Gsoil 348 TaxID=661478 RepID=A0A068NQC1_FIMGI|nr:A24 family peptidase [Fimbriimonas ginsengisoli]AIE85768.1 leader peptidase PppA [Fimbriimonas ginsengisoli Gsoil 348]